MEWDAVGGRHVQPQTCSHGAAGLTSRTLTDPRSMYDHNQSQLPHSFIELFIPPGKIKPSETREVIVARYDLCEDMAQMLTEHASAKLFELGVTEQDVLERMHLGLLQDPTAVTAPEARWIVCRLAELLDWPMGGWLQPG